jgi:hypothetical protein
MARWEVSSTRAKRFLASRNESSTVILAIGIFLLQKHPNAIHMTVPAK